MMESEITVLNSADPAFEARLDSELLRRAVQAAVGEARADGVDIPGGTEVSLLITDNDQVRRLNREYRGVDRPTDVLSFSLQEGPELGVPPDTPRQAGEVVVSYPYAEAQAHELNHSLDLELAWLIIHGTLQLFGYAHDTDADAVHMEALEDRALRGMGFSRTPREP